ncbi:MAG: DoxX family membrane protein [Deltaproteobacteria bacterium]|nr:DoxX family membrane protein [Deltaproteobacteria bacterium]MBW2070898.1 DoxX family membrane protein [Deltaproteobacteria bacterium]
MGKVAALTVRFVLGAVFLYASVDKILHPQAFAEIVYNYQILPDSLINVTALILPWLELLLGLSLISGICLPGSVLLANLLLVTFLAALLFNAVRGLDIQCGCFSTSALQSESAMIWYLVREVLFLVLSGYLFCYIFRGKRASSLTL